MSRLVVLYVMVLLEVIYTASGRGGTQGILEGSVRDKQTGEPIAATNVYIIELNIGSPTDASGYYRLHNVRAGTYQVRFSHVGYQSRLVKDVVIYPDLRTRLNAELDPSDINLDEVTVLQERPLIQKDLPATAYSIGEVKLDKLPVSNFKEVLGLQPGTTLEGNVRGGKITDVVYLIDGLPVQDVIGGGIGTDLPKSAITRMSVHTGGLDAEYGNTLSGVVNVVTKSGSGHHDFALRLERDSWIPERWQKQQDRATELELTASGPIRDGKLFYFTANTMSLTDTRWWQDFKRFYLSPISREFAGFGKIEYDPGSDVRFTLQGIYSLRDWYDYEFSWRFNLDGLPPRKRYSYRIALMMTHLLSPTVYYTLSLSRFTLQTKVGTGSSDALSLQPYEYDFFLRYVVGGKRNWWADTRENVNTLKGDIVMEVGHSHVLKAGMELNLYDVNSSVLKFEPQLTYFGKPIVAAPMLNYSTQYSYRPRSGSVFIQDKVEFVEDGSNASFGVRWDFFDPTASRPIVEFVPFLPGEYRQEVSGYVKSKFKHQISPRIAVAVPLGPSTALFTNFGHYFQFPLFDQLYSGINPAELRAGSRNILVGNPDLEPERTVAWEVGIKHSFASYHVLSVTYFKKTFKNQVDSKTLIPFDSKVAGDYGFASYVNNAYADATGLEVVLSQERGEKISGSISYTYMVTDAISEYVDQTINYAQWGFPLVTQAYPLSWDQRHTVKVDADFTLFGGIQANMIVLYNSPRPYTYYPTRDGFTPLDSTKGFLPNNRRMEDMLFVNGKLTKKFEIGQGGQVLTLYLDGRNILNKKNIRWMDSSGRIGGELGDPSAYYDPRRIRFGLRMDL